VAFWKFVFTFAFGWTNNLSYLQNCGKQSPYKVAFSRGL
jgi:hypothetical protein